MDRARATCASSRPGRPPSAPSMAIRSGSRPHTLRPSRCVPARARYLGVRIAHVMTQCAREEHWRCVPLSEYGHAELRMLCQLRSAPWARCYAVKMLTLPNRDSSRALATSTVLHSGLLLLWRRLPEGRGRLLLDHGTR